MRFRRELRFEAVVGSETIEVVRDRDGVVRARGRVLGTVRRDPDGRGIRRFVAESPEGERVTAGHTGEKAAIALAYAVLRRIVR
jgi:hypothetical protein